MDSIYCLRQRANIDTFWTKGKVVIIYEDHRYILNVLKYARVNQITDKSINLISIDYHSDSYNNAALMTKDKIENVLGFGLKEFWNYIEFEHHFQDDDWVVSGMEYGLINDIAMLFVEDRLDHLEFGKVYTDLHENKHLPIKLRVDSDPNIFEKFEEIIGQEFILDIDLDFATKKNNGKHIALSKKELDRFFDTRIINWNNLSVDELFRDLISKAKFIAICKESEFCGGFNSSNKILCYLDNRFFDNKLVSYRQ